MRDFFTQLVKLDLDKGRSPLLRGGVKFYGNLDLGPGRYLARVLVRNSETGRTGVQTVEVDVPSYEAGAPTILPPLFIEPPGRWIMVRSPQDEDSGGNIVHPFTVNGEPYVPAARPRLRPREASRLCLVAYNLPRSATGDGELDVEGRVFDRDGDPVAGGRLLDVERTVTGLEGVDKLLATFRPQGLAAGDYRLQIAVTDPVTGDRQTGSISFEVL